MPIKQRIKKEVKDLHFTIEDKNSGNQIVYNDELIRSYYCYDVDINLLECRNTMAFFVYTTKISIEYRVEINLEKGNIKYLSSISEFGVKYPLNEVKKRLKEDVLLAYKASRGSYTKEDVTNAVDTVYKQLKATLNNREIMYNVFR